MEWLRGEVSQISWYLSRVEQIGIENTAVEGGIVPLPYMTCFVSSVFAS